MTAIFAFKAALLVRGSVKSYIPRSCHDPDSQIGNAKKSEVVMLRPGLFLAGALALSVSMIADVSAQGRGTNQERDACTRDVTRFCRKVMEQGDMVILGCLQQNRAKLSKGCVKVLTDNGQ